MKRKIFKTSMFIFGAIAGAAVLFLRFADSETFPSKMEARVLYPDSVTLFADGYTDQGFSKIKVGFSKQSVRTILGQPLAIGKAKEIREFSMISGGTFFPDVSATNRFVIATQEIWFYSAPSGSSRYESRAIYFESNKVTKKEACFYD